MADHEPPFVGHAGGNAALKSAWQTLVPAPISTTWWPFKAVIAGQDAVRNADYRRLSNSGQSQEDVMMLEKRGVFVLSLAMMGVANAQTESGTQSEPAQSEPAQSGSSNSDSAQSGSSDSGSTQSGSKIDIFPKDERTYSQQEQDRNQREAQKGYEAQKREEQNEIMRDKSHDRRLKTDDDTSIGVDATPEPNVNIRRTY
jgi:hypothetical protein